jgi:hypothetical protein
MKTRAEWEAEPMIGNQRTEVLALLDERDEARAEADDFRRAWAILDEPREIQRMDGTAEDAAHRFVSLLRAAEADAARLREVLKGVADNALLNEARARDVQSALSATSSAQWLEQHDARVRTAALADAPFVAAALETARLETLDVAIAICRPWAESGPSQGASVASAIAEEIRALKETNPPPAKPCATCHRDADHVGGRFGPPCPECTEVKR